ncbi:hypothetical protein ACIP98_29145 [Streptomyces sp. NPDC088354]|uniref:Mom family adenine methylcarbamoylation protein n=1 Tax=Streptomyces sp. NPDC088354 TaxID=3365856 RepID=UPI003821D625
MSPTFEQLSLDGLSQRWRHRRHSWRHTSDGGFDPARYQTRPLPAAPARAFVTEHHYSSSWPATRLAFGLYDRATGPRGGALVGVLALGVPMHATVLTGVFPQLAPYRSALELSRLVLLDSCEANSESFFISKALHMAAAVGIRGILAHSDPHVRQRTTPSGNTEQYLPGHWGGCYQASNMSYLGKTRPRTLVMLPDGTILYSGVRAGSGGVPTA